MNTIRKTTNKMKKLGRKKICNKKSNLYQILTAKVHGFTFLFTSLLSAVAHRRPSRGHVGFILCSCVSVSVSAVILHRAVVQR